MATKKMKLKIINGHDEGSLSLFVEEFISQVENPETMQIQFEVSKTHSGNFLFFAFILFDGVLTKRVR